MAIIELKIYLTKEEEIIYSDDKGRFNLEARLALKREIQKARREEYLDL